MNFINPQNKKVNFSQRQEIVYSDLNSVSAYLHQILKDFNTNVVQGPLTDYSFPAIYGLIISGLEVEVYVEPGPLSYVRIKEGVVNFAPTSASQYMGTLVKVPERDTLGPIVFPTTGNPPIDYYIDIRYTEILDTATKVRNKFTSQPPGGTVEPFNASTSKLAQVEFDFNTSAGLADGWIRLATIRAYDDLTTAYQYALPVTWIAQGWNNWPSGQHSFDTDYVVSLQDSLSNLRAEISAIIGPFTNWFDTPPVTLPQLKSDVNALAPAIFSLMPGFKNCSVFGGGSGSIVIPAGVTRLYVKMWGPGGNAGVSYDTRFFGGAGGRGAYVEELINVSPGETLSYVVGAGGSLVNTSLTGFFGSIAAGAGQHGTNATAVTYGADGATGWVSFGTFVRKDGLESGARYRHWFTSYTNIPNSYLNYVEAPFVMSENYYSCGGYAVRNSAGTVGKPGLLVVLWE